MLLENIFQLTVSDAIPNVLDISYHEVFHIYVISPRGCCEDVWQVRQFLDLNYRVVNRWLKQLSDAICYEDSNLVKEQSKYSTVLGAGQGKTATLFHLTLFNYTQCPMHTQ